MKKGHLILGIILLIGLFVFIPNGAADDEGLLADYFKFKEEAETYSQGEISPDYSPSFGAADDVGDLAAYCDEQCYDEGCYAACGMEPDAAECTTVRDDPNTPEDEFYVSPGCYARIAYQECLSKCDAAREDCWNECMSKGETTGKCGNGICDAGENCATCPNDCPCGQGKICNPGDSNADARGCAMPRMALTVFTGKNTYSPGETVIVQGSVKDAKGNAIPDVSFVIEVEGIDISTLSGTVYDVTCCGGQFNLPKDVSEGTYTVKVTASKTGYPGVSKTTSITVVLPTITLCPSTVPGAGENKRIEITGTGFGAYEHITGIVLTSAKFEGGGGAPVTEPGGISADAAGSFRVKVNLPFINPNDGIMGPKYRLDAVGVLHIASAEFTVGLSKDEIKKIYYEWGEKPYRWPDGSTDKHALFHHNSWGGLGANAKDTFTTDPFNPDYQEASHFGCVACQWKTLYFFVQQGKKGNLGGWEFAPIQVGWGEGESLAELFGHHAVVLYPTHSNWRTEGYVFDPHPTGKPEGSVKHISDWDNFRWSIKFDDNYIPRSFGCKWVDGSPVRDYDIGCNFSKAYMYPYETEPNKYGGTNIFGGGNWITPEELRARQEGYQSGAHFNPNSHFYAKCPVNVLVVNSAGERLGLTENDEWISEFKPEKFDTWPGEDNTPVWYFELPKGDTYTFSITGTGSGNLEVFASPEESNVVFKYPSVDVSIGDKFSMKLDASDPGTPLDTPSGQVSPTKIPIEEFIAVVEPIEGNNPPTASFSIIPENPKVGDYIVVASTSFDPDDDKLTYSWYRDGSEIGNSPNWEWENPQAGE
ncbi:MAG: hypothetical protein IMF18_12560, partial [Proteobacteria bacterium]|nr:hypothetical protein [Pseudomonadota bacterium]